LPELVKRDDTKEVLRATLYEVFTTEHFQRKAREIERSDIQIPKGYDLEDSFNEYSKDLAV
jgi:hypothetical protein